MNSVKATLIWFALTLAVTVPVFVAARSPLLAWREPVYIAAGFAGVIAMALLLAQPLLAGGYLPGLPARRGRRVHRVVGAALVLAVIVHVAGLWVTSPPDVIDVLLFRSPTPFSLWGVIAMWGVFAAAFLSVVRRRLSLRVWRIGHTSMVGLVVATSAVHAILIQGTMGTVSKTVLCLLALAATTKVILDMRVWRHLFHKRG
ncbi:ferric reductase-like transmembrane domain-containing protein [Antarctobacter heliothermus]|uniref:Ferric reductase like transmembrane component n=1 Tax=Antarctobacter heliothermus TaxID=74033 RepID=A0A239ER58_9RHOB|nr:ferric reductase-like transmembrane domain-containing protein [Antarctobacter heliothermus]SNS46758.1 Ferric reductase like transmembrane component [Antarctobacter heliothermus]